MQVATDLTVYMAFVPSPEVHEPYFKDHMRRHENLSMEKYKCNTCGIVLCTNSALQKHVERVHLGVKAYQCKTCDKKFKTGSILKRHIQVIHEGVKKLTKHVKDFNCELCGKLYSGKLRFSHPLYTDFYPLIILKIPQFNHVFLIFFCIF